MPRQPGFSSHCVATRMSLSRPSSIAPICGVVLQSAPSRRPLGVATVDVGNPMLSMHAIREMGAEDPPHMIKVMTLLDGAVNDGL